MSLARKSILHFLTSAVLTGSSILVTLVTVPMLIELIGETSFGQFRILFEWISLLGTFNLAFASFMGIHLSRQPVPGKPSPFVIKQLQNAGYGILMLMIPFIVLLIIFAPRIAQGSEHLRLAAFLGCLPFIFLPLTVYQSQLDAINQSFTANSLLTVQRFFLAALSVGFAYLSPTVTSQFYAILVAQIAFYLALIKVSRLPFSLPDLKPSTAHFTLWKNDFPKVAPFLKMDFAGKLSLAADSLVLGLFLAPAQVTLFFLWIRLPSTLTSQLMSFGNSVWVSLLEVKRSGGPVEVVYLKTLKVIAVLSAMCGGICISFNALFIQWWIPGTPTPDFYWTILAGLNLFLISLISFGGWILTAFEGESRFADLSLKSGVMNLIFSLILTYFYGFAGPLLGSFVVYGFYKGFRTLQLVSQLLAIESKNSVYVLTKVLLCGALAFPTLKYLTGDLNPILSFTVCFFSFLILSWSFIFSSDDQKWILRKLRRESI